MAPSAPDPNITTIREAIDYAIGNDVAGWEPHMRMDEIGAIFDPAVDAVERELADLRAGVDLAVRALSMSERRWREATDALTEMCERVEEFFRADDLLSEHSDVPEFQEAHAQALYYMRQAWCDADAALAAVEGTAADDGKTESFRHAEGTAATPGEEEYPRSGFCAWPNCSCEGGKLNCRTSPRAVSAEPRETTT